MHNNRRQFFIAFCLWFTPLLTATGYELKHNPFHNPIEASRSNNLKPSVSVESLNLKATLISSLDAYANISGEILQVGDMVDGYRIEKITEGKVIFSMGGQTFTKSLED